MMQKAPDNESEITVMLGGDVMLGRNVKKYMQQHGATYPLGGVSALMRNADITIVNLECAITSATAIWPGSPKAFYFGAPMQAVHVLLDAGVDMVSLANNHVLDFGVDGLKQTLMSLDSHGIAHSGAGVNAESAHYPARFSCKETVFGMVSFCNHQPDFAASENKPGIAYLDLEDEQQSISSLQSALSALQQHTHIDWPVLSLHWGPNMAFRPSDTFRRIAHAAIDMGWKILFGHSAHVFQGIEIYKECPIIYAAGDLVDDYYVDPLFKNDHQLLIQLELNRTSLQRIRLYPVLIADCRTQFATGNEFEYIVKWMTGLCDELGSRVQREANTIWIEG